MSLILVNFLIATILLTTVLTIKPVCFNCQCSTYFLDTHIQCKNAELDKSKAYFTLQTTNVTVVKGSDVMLAVQLKQHHDEYCWCTDALLEWNALHSNSSGQLLVILMNNVSKVETGHYWAVLYLQSKYYFSDPIYLNVTGTNEVPSPHLEADPKIGALVVAILVVTIMVFGFIIYCVQMAKRRRRNRRQKKLFNNAMHELGSADATMPLTWPIKSHHFTLQESESENMPQNPSSTQHQISDIDDGAASSSSTHNSNKSVSGDVKHSASISSSDMSSKETEETEPKGSRQNVTKSNSSITKSTKRRRHRSLSPVSPKVRHIPITDDRFTTKRSWYKSLNTEVTSGPLLKDPALEIKREQKKMRKSLAKVSSDNIASGILRSGDLGSGVLGSTSKLHQERMEHLRQLYTKLTIDFRYGRSLPTPQPAGRRPTVMAMFPVEHAHQTNMSRNTATIHTSNPIQHRRVQTLFNNMSDRSRSVTFSEKNLTKRFSSVDGITTVTSSNNTAPRKSNLKICKDKQFEDIIEADSGVTSNSKENPSPDRSKSHATDSGHESEPSSTTDRKLDVPELALVPASPTSGTPPSPTKSRFTVIPISSKNGSLDSIQDIPDQTDPLALFRGQWNFSENGSDENLLNNTNSESYNIQSYSTYSRQRSSPRPMDRLRVPGMFDNQHLDGYWSS